MRSSSPLPPLAPAWGGAGFWAVLSRILKLSREIALTLVAVLGLLCIVALVLGFACKASFVVFRTGSMEPLYPVGALSLTVQVPAAELVPGDVVSVKRSGSGVLVTHRVVAVEPAGSAASLRLKGDANGSEDPLPYQVDTAQKVLATVPAVGTWVMAMRGPGFIAATSMAVAGLVVWAYWPKRVARHKGVVSTGR